MKLSSLKVNSAAIQKGRWIDDLPDLGDIRVLVRGLNNPDYRRLQQKMVRALPPNKRRNGAVDPQEMDRITGVCLARHALLDWQNVEDDGGNALPYSKEQAEEFMSNPDYRKFRDGVFIAASQVEEEDEEDNEATEKNSGQPSATT